MDKQKIIELLIKNSVTIATAESCTGGLLAKTITDSPGSSSIFKIGVVTYSNESKKKLLNVKSETLEKFGAVSQETALEMCKGLKGISNCDICVSITGIAGPGGGSKEKPIGLVYVCINNEIYRLKLSGTRAQIREQTVEFTLNKIGEKL